MIKKVIVPALVIVVLFAVLRPLLYPGWEVQLFIAVATEWGYHSELEKCVSGWFQEGLTLEEHWQYGQ